MSILKKLTWKHRKGKKGYFVLIDPDKQNENIDRILFLANKNNIDGILIGGSEGRVIGFDKLIKYIKNNSKIPVILFPGSHSQISDFADGILSLSLINSKSYKYIIGEQLEVSDILYKSDIEIINTAYIVFARYRQISVAKKTGIDLFEKYSDKQIKKLFYLASNMNFDSIYLEAGSGAKKTIDNNIIKIARAIIDKPIIVGGGIKNIKTAEKILKSGADFIVTGNIIEKNAEMINEFSNYIKEYNKSCI